MNRSLKLSILMALALGSSQAAAVELGQAHIRSALGQPLLVEIPVTHATPAELHSLSAQLASNDEFAKIGGQRPTIPLQFSVADVNGHKVIRITSSASVDDPYLDLLVQVSSSTGSSVREFAILLDPPGSKVARAPASSAPAHQRTPASAASAPAPAPHPAAAPSAPSHATAAVKNGQYGPVQKGQTLSAVAKATAPAGVNTDQMLLALKAANPDAFYRDNINALKAGTVLRIPTRDDALATTAAAAAAAVRQQNSDWRNGSVPTPVAVAAGGTRAKASVAPAATSSGDRLALVPPGSEGKAAGGKGGANASIRQELQRSQETLSSLQQQSTDLKSRLKDLEDLNNKNQRLLSLKDNEIAALQKQLNDARKAAGLPAAPVAAAPAAAEPAKPALPAPAASAHPATANAVAAAASTPKPATATAAAADHAPAVTTPLKTPTAKPATHKAPAPAVAEQPWYMQTWAMATGGGVIVLLLLAGLMARRKKPGAATAGAAALSSSSKASLADRFGTVDVDNLDLPGGAGSDPDQDELLDQLAEHPDDIGLHLELVSLYYSRRDVEHFEAAAEAMHAHITHAGQPEWQDVVHMGEDLVPAHPLFAQAAIPTSEHDEQSPLHHFDLDSYAGGLADEAVAHEKPHAPQPSTVSEYHFDFDLTPAPHHAEPHPAAAHVAAPAPSAQPEPASTWRFDEPAETDAPLDAGHEQEFGELHDDPIDTKLDLARAYLDMGDPDGARAMLDEVMHEGSQMQKDVAKTLMAKIG